MLSEANDDITVSATQIGKTTVARCKIISWAWAAGPLPHHWWWIAPSYMQSYHGLSGAMRLAESAGILDDFVGTSSGPTLLTLINGGAIEGRSWSNPKGLMGDTINGGVCDEFGQLRWPDYAAFDSRRSATNGPVMWIGQPGEVGGPAESLWNRAVAGEKGFAYRVWTWRERGLALPCCKCVFDTPDLSLHPEAIHEEGCARGLYVGWIGYRRSTMPTSLYRATYEGQWINYNERPVYESYNAALNDDPTLTLDPVLPLCIGFDFNVDPMAAEVWQFHKGQSYSIDEVVVRGGDTTRAVCRELLRRYGAPRDPELRVILHGDATGRHRDTRSLDSDWDIIQKTLGARWPKLEIRVPQANPEVVDRVNAVNARLLSDDGTVRHTINPVKCPMLKRDFERVGWIAGTREIAKLKDQADLTHFSDALGYGIAHEFPIAGEVRLGLPDENDPYVSSIMRGDL